MEAAGSEIAAVFVVAEVVALEAVVVSGIVVGFVEVGEDSAVAAMMVIGAVVAEALAIREVDLVMVMLMDMVLQVAGLVDRAATVLRVKVTDHLVVGMVLEGAAIGAISSEKDLVGMMTGMSNDRDTRCGWVRYIFSSCFLRVSPRFGFAASSSNPAVGGVCKYQLILLCLCCHQRKYISIFIGFLLGCVLVWSWTRFG